MLCSPWAAGLYGNKNCISPVATKQIHSIRSPFVTTKSDMLSKRAKGFGCDELLQCDRKLFCRSISDQPEWSWNSTGRVRGGRGGFCRPPLSQTLRSGFRAASAKSRQSYPQQQLIPLCVQYTVTSSELPNEIHLTLLSIFVLPPAALTRTYLDTLYLSYFELLLRSEPALLEFAVLLPLTTFLSPQKAAREGAGLHHSHRGCCSQRWPEGIWVTRHSTASITAVSSATYVYLTSTLVPFPVVQFGAGAGRLPAQLGPASVLCDTSWLRLNLLALAEEESQALTALGCEFEWRAGRSRATQERS